jgi:hypothetical protein
MLSVQSKLSKKCARQNMKKKKTEGEKKIEFPFSLFVYLPFAYDNW